MRDWKRIAIVTAGLSVAGAAVGGVLGGAVMAAVRVWHGGLAALSGGAADVLFGGAFCAAFGAVLGPLSAWLLMRRVPLWLAIGGTSLGTLAGMVFALTATPTWYSAAPLAGIIFYPLLGFGASALVLRVAYRPGRAALAAGESPARLAGGDPR